MGKFIDYKALGNQCLSGDAEARKVGASVLMESIEAGETKPEDFSIRALFESTVEGGREFLDWSGNRKKSGRDLGGVELLEAANAIDLSTFSNITGQIVYRKIMDSLKSPQFIWPELCEEEQTPFPNGERIPGIGEVGDQINDVGEGQEYGAMGVNEEYIDTPPTTKKGGKVPVTREAIEFDRTGLVLKRAGNLGFSQGLRMEKRIIDAATGQDFNNYKRNGVGTNTFLTSGAYINDIASGNTLTDWTSIQAVELLFDAIVDPNTGEPVVLESTTLVVPSALKYTARRILAATGVRFGDGASSTTATYSPNPVDRGFYGQRPYTIASNAYVKARTSSATKWFLGDFKKAIVRQYNWDWELTQAADNAEAKFNRDIWMQFKISTRDAVAIVQPRYMARSA